MLKIIARNARRPARHLSLFASLLVLLSGATARAQYGPYVNGGTFVIGLYDYPGRGIPDSHFSDIKNYFNTVDYFCHNANWDSGDTPETLTAATLNSAATNGLYITSEMWVTSDPAHDYCDTPSQFVTGSSFYNDLQTFGAYPALLMFANRDEADDYMSATQCVAASNFMGTNGQGKNVWLNLSSMMDHPVNVFQQYVPGATVVSTDAYPDEWGGNVDSEKNAVDTLHAITPVSKMIILPGYPAANGNILNSNTMSYVTYGCVIHGAAGVWYWGCDQIATTSDPMWQNIRTVGSQLKFMQSALVNPKAWKFYNSYTGAWEARGIVSSGGSGNLETLLITNASYDYLITANTATSAQTYAISLITGWRGGTNLWYFCGPGGTSNQVLGGNITYGPKQVVVYASQPINVPPIITTPLSPQTTIAGATVSLTVEAVSWWPATYQWYFNGNLISGQNAATLTLGNVQTNNAGSYSVVISNYEGSSTNAASLAVQPTFGPSAIIASDLDVMTNGALVFAWDLSGTPATVNGVTFTGANSTTTLGANVTLSGFYANYNAYGSSAAPCSGLSSGYQTILAGGDYASGATATTVTFNNLTVGRSYAVQLWVNDSRPAGNGRIMTLTSSSGGTVTLSYNSTGGDGGVGQYAINTFTAGATTQTFTLAGNTSTQFNALQLRDISGNTPITFGPATSIAGDTDVATAGALVWAYDLSGITATVNGVTFTGSTSTTALGANVTLSGFGGGNYNGYGSDITNLSASYTNILTGGDYANGATVATVTLNHLTVGHSYAVQLWVDDSRTFGFGLGRTIAITTIATNANSVTLGYDVNGLGQYTIGTFMAGTTTQTLTIFGNASTQINALQLRDISGSSPITFGGATTVSGDTDVMTNGRPVWAYDLSGANATVNGLTFTGASSAAALGTNVTLSGFYGNYNGFATGLVSGFSAGYMTVLTGGDYAVGDNAGTVTFNNLTAGHSYAVQLWVNDSRSFGSGRNLVAESIAVGGTSVALSYNSTSAAGGVGQYVIGTFPATGASQTFTLAGNASTQLNALQLRDITSAASQVTGTTLGAGGVTAAFAGAPGFSYTVERAEDVRFMVGLTDVVTTNMPGTGVFYWTDSAPSKAAAFYRLRYNP